jgi:hypothetical protein
MLHRADKAAQATPTENAFRSHFNSGFMIDFTEIPHNNNDTWELFARDFLEELGFFIESPPDRGPDGGKDMLITEEVTGKLHRYRFRWLVSCKHFAHSRAAVNENDHEKNILERVKGFRADGFIGFYSTLPSSGLNLRLKQLRDNSEIKDYRIFDGRIIENHLVTKGYSRLTFRYFPVSHKTIRPLHNVIDEYVELKCDTCGRDLLEALYENDCSAVVAHVAKHDIDRCHILETYFACKGKCDEQLQSDCYKKYGEVTNWEDLSDIASPNQYLQRILSTIIQLAQGRYSYSQIALDKEKQLIIALAQKVFREVSETERARMRELLACCL